MDPVTSARLAHEFRCCGTVPIREGTADTGVTLSSLFSPCPGATLLSLLLDRSATELSLSHRLCPQKTTARILCHPSKPGLCGSPAILSMVFLQQKIPPLKEQCPKISLCCFSRRCSGARFWVSGNSHQDAWML